MAIIQAGSRTLYRGGEDGDPTKAVLQWWGTMLLEWRSAIGCGPAGCTWSPSHIAQPLQPADCWSMIYILHSQYHLY